MRARRSWSCSAAASTPTPLRPSAATTASSSIALSIDYGQRHASELEAARARGRARSAWPATSRSTLDLSRFGGSALTTRDAGAAGSPARRRRRSRSPTCRRATRFFCRWRWRGPRCSGRRHRHRRQRARLLGLSRLPSGVHRGLRAARARWPRAPASKGSALTIRTPLMRPDQGRHHPLGLSLGPRLRPDAQLLRSRAGRRPCRHCDSCRLRAAGFAAAGVADPPVGMSRLTIRLAQHFAPRVTALTSAPWLSRCAARSSF